MTRRCELTGKLPLSGQLRSHAENKTKRKFRPNLCEVTLISDALGRKVRLRVSAHALKSVEHRGGLDAFLLKADDEELSERCLKLKREVKKAQGSRQGSVGRLVTPFRSASRRSSALASAPRGRSARARTAAAACAAARG